MPQMKSLQEGVIRNSIQSGIITPWHSTGGWIAGHVGSGTGDLRDLFFWDLLPEENVLKSVWDPLEKGRGRF